MNGHPEMETVEPVRQMQSIDCRSQVQSHTVVFCGNLPDNTIIKQHKHVCICEMVGIVHFCIHIFSCCFN